MNSESAYLLEPHPLTTRRWKYGLVFLLALISSFLLSVVYEAEFLYFLVLLGIVIFSIALVEFDAALLFVPLALTNPYTLRETQTNLHLSEFVLLVIFGAWLVKILFDKQEYVFPKDFLIPSFIIIFVSALSLLVARQVVAGVEQIVRYVEILLVLFVVLINHCREEKRIKQIFLYLIIGGLLASIVGLTQFVTGTLTTGETRRIFGWHGGGYGALIASTLLFCVSTLMYERGRQLRFWAILTLPFSAVALVLSQTRAWIAAFGVVLVLTFFLAKKRNVRKLLLVLVLIVATAAALVQTDLFGLAENNLLGVAFEHAFRFGSGDGRSSQDISLLLRLNAWQKAIPHFLDSPLLGIGVGNLRFENYITGALARPAPGAGYVDNQYLQFFVEGGLISGIAWIVYVFAAIRLGRRALALTADTRLYSLTFGLFASLLVFAIGSLLWVITPHHELFALMVLDISLLFNIARIAQADSQELLGQN